MSTLLITDLLSNGFGVRFRAPGRSMYPTIREGETITVHPVELWKVKPGDILLYRVDKRVIAHRLVSIEGKKFQPSVLSTFLFRSDASGACDEPVAAQQVLGKVVSVERGGHSIGLYSWRAKIFRMAFCLKRYITRNSH